MNGNIKSTRQWFTKDIGARTSGWQAWCCILDIVQYSQRKIHISRPHKTRQESDLKQSLGICFWKGDKA